MEPWESLRESAKINYNLAELRDSSEVLASTMRGLVEAGANEGGIKRAWDALKSTRNVVKRLDIDVGEKRNIMQQCLQVKSSIDRLRIDAMTKNSPGSPQAQFATLAYLYARGQFRDKFLLNRISSSETSAGSLRVKVERTLELRQKEERREQLLRDYHSVLFKVQRGSGTEDDERRLVFVASELERLERFELNEMRDKEVQRLRDNLKILEEGLREVLETLRTVHDQTKEDEPL